MSNRRWLIYSGLSVLVPVATIGIYLKVIGGYINPEAEFTSETAILLIWLVGMPFALGAIIGDLLPIHSARLVILNNILSIAIVLFINTIMLSLSAGSEAISTKEEYFNRVLFLMLFGGAIANIFVAAVEIIFRPTLVKQK